MSNAGIATNAAGTKGQLTFGGAVVAEFDGNGLAQSSNPATGLRSTIVATMQKFADEFVASLAANGYQKLPTGLIIQWGTTGAIAAGGTLAVTLPIAYTTTHFAVVAIESSAGASTTPADVGVSGLSTTGFTIASRNSVGTTTTRWISVGV